MFSLLRFNQQYAWSCIQPGILLASGTMKICFAHSNKLGRVRGIQTIEHALMSITSSTENEERIQTAHYRYWAAETNPNRYAGGLEKEQ